MIITIDGLKCEAEKGEYILDIAKRNNIFIPTLCHSPALPGQGNCRLCIVEVIERGRSRVVTACLYPVEHEVEVVTNSQRIREMRRTIIMLLYARAPKSALMQGLKDEYNVSHEERFTIDWDEDCILCGLCVRACEAMGLNAISMVGRGTEKKAATPFDEPSEDCIGCAACAEICPTDVIKVEDRLGIRRIWGKEFKMVRCSKCGKYFETEEYRKHVSGISGEETEPLCERCKRSIIAEGMADVYSDI